MLLFPFEPRPVEHAAIASGPSHAYQSRASRYRTVLPRSLALGALGARIFFSLERSAAAKVRILKRMRSRNCTNRLYYKYHTRIAHRSQRKISTRQCALGNSRALRTRPVYSPTRSRYLPRMSCSISLRPSSSPTLPISRLTA